MGKSNGNRRVYTAEFKREARPMGTRLSKNSGKTRTEIERELGLSSGLLKHWLRQGEAEGMSAFRDIAGDFVAYLHGQLYHVPALHLTNCSKAI